MADTKPTAKTRGGSSEKGGAKKDRTARRRRRGHQVRGNTGPVRGSQVDRLILSALVNETVQDGGVRHLMEDETYLGAFCVAAPATPERAHVVFEFQSAPPRFSFF